MFRRIFVVMVVFALSLAGAIPVFAQSNTSAAVAGAVYLESNSPSGNQVMVYNRLSDGSLSFVGAFNTGGLGSGIGVTVPPDPLGSQNSILLAPNGRWLFVVDAGSNEVSSFQVLANGLELVDKEASGGSYPVSLTFYDGFLYVLNAAGNGSISGFQVIANGHLRPLKNSTRSLNAATPPAAPGSSQPMILESPAQVGFSPDGEFLAVTDKGGLSGKGYIDTFKVSDGLPATSMVRTQTAGAVPFAFTFDSFGHLVVVDASTGSVTSYSIHNNGTLETNSTAYTGQAATCWIASNGRNVYTDNTGSGTLSGFALSRSGDVSPLTASSIVGTTGSGTLPLDMGISRDGHFVYSLETGAGVIGAFMINDNGSLTPLGVTGSFPAVGGFQGIAVH